MEFIAVLQWISDHPDKIAGAASLFVCAWTWIREEIRKFQKDSEEARLEEENRKLRESFDAETRRLRQEIADAIKRRKDENSKPNGLGQ